MRLCRIVAPERLSDRFLTSGVLTQQEGDFDAQKSVILCYVLEITRPWFPSSTVFAAVRDALAETLPSLTPGETLIDQIEELLRLVNRRLADISDQGETDWIGNLNGMIVAIGGNELHFSQAGSIPAYLLQNNRIRQITDDQPQQQDPNPLRTFANLSSGQLQEDDRILFGTHELYRELSLDALRRIVGKSSPYQASQSILRELKRAKNPGVLSTIVWFGATPGATEPDSVSLEEALRTPMQKVVHTVTPIAHKTIQHGKRATGALKKAAEVGAQYVQEKAIPATGRIIKAGENQAEQVFQKIDTKFHTTSPALTDIPVEDPLADGTIIIRLYPQVKVRTKTSPLVAAQRAFFISLHKLAQAYRWVQATQLRRRVGLAGIIVVCAGVGTLAIYARKQPVALTPTQSQNTTVITRLREIEAAVKTETNQTTLAQLTTEANTQYDALQSPGEGQKREADRLWISITDQLDTITKTVRFVDSTESYTLPAAGKQVIASLPFMYATPSGNLTSLLRTGKGNASATQRTLPITGDEVPVALTRSLEADTAGYIFTNQRSMYRITQEDAETTLRKVELDGGEKFSSGDMIGTYHGNLYIVDSVNGLLWRYATTGTAYGKGSSVIDKTKYDLKGATSFAIDGAIYLLKKDGTVQKFVTGKQDTNFALTGIPEASPKVVQPLQILTNENTDNLYLLDGGITSSARPTARILEFSKSGSFIRQFAFPASVTAVKSVDISEQERMIWALSGDKVTAFSLPQ